MLLIPRRVRGHSRGCLLFLGTYCCSCTTNVYKMDAYAGARGFDPELRQYASSVPSPCVLTVINTIALPLNWASRDIACTEWNRQ